jgi:hypothetical protein
MLWLLLFGAKLRSDNRADKLLPSEAEICKSPRSPNKVWLLPIDLVVVTFILFAGPKASTSLLSIVIFWPSPACLSI